MNGFYRRLIDNHPFANIAFALVLIGGLVTYLMMPRAQDPEINFNWVAVVVTLPGASAEDMEREVTSPLEDAVRKVKDIKFVASSSRESITSLLVRFEEISERDFDKRMNDLRREIQNKAAAELPPDANEPEIVEFSSSNGFPSAVLVLHGAGGGEQLRSTAFALTKDIERIAGVDQVLTLGFHEPQLQVNFDPSRLAAAGLSPLQLSDGVATWFRNALGGRVNVYDREWLVRLEGKTEDPERLAQMAVITPDGRIAVGDIAEVVRGEERTKHRVSYNAQPAIMMTVTKDPNSNTLDLVERLNAFVAERNPLLNSAGVELVVVDDQTHATRHAIGVMESNALFGFFAVLGMCWVFLGARLALLVGLGVPFALAGTFMLVAGIGSTLNLTVLLGVVIVLGMLVDDAVVVVEAIYYRMQRGEAPSLAVMEGVREVALPVISSVLTTISAFLPLMLLPGILGKFMFLVPFVVTAGLLVSLVEAFWMLPTHVLGIRPDFVHRRSRAQELRERFTHWLRVKYSLLLIRLMRWPKSAFAIILLIMVGAGGAVASGVVKMQFFAFDSMRLFYVNIDLPAGVTIDRTLAEAERMAKIVSSELEASELRSVTAYAGMKFTETEPVYGDYYAQLMVSLKPRNGELREASEVIAELRPMLVAVQGEARVSFLELKGGPPTSRPINVKVKSDDYAALRAATDALLAEVAKIPGVRDITDDDVSGRSELRLSLNREKLANAGASPLDVARLVRLYGEGETIAVTRGQGEKIEVLVRARPERFGDVTEILQRPVPLPPGADGRPRSVQLGELVDAEMRVSKGYIRHYQLKRAITVEADLDQSLNDTLAANTQLQQAWEKLQPRFPTVELDFSGELDDIKESLDSMAVLFSLGVGMIYLILATQFRSYWQPLMILLTVPLAFTGVILGLLVSSNPLSLYTMYGVIALAGIAVNSAIVLIDAANARLAAGMSVLHASIYAARRRVVPILITSTTTIGGLFALATGIGGKSLMWGPVAASIVWGLGFSTVLTLFAIPLIYRLVMRGGQRKV